MAMVVVLTWVINLLPNQSQVGILLLRRQRMSQRSYPAILVCGSTSGGLYYKISPLITKNGQGHIRHEQTGFPKIDRRDKDAFAGIPPSL